MLDTASFLATALPDFVSSGAAGRSAEPRHVVEHVLVPSLIFSSTLRARDMAWFFRLDRSSRSLAGGDTSGKLERHDRGGMSALALHNPMDLEPLRLEAQINRDSSDGIARPSAESSTLIDRTHPSRRMDGDSLMWEGQQLECSRA